MPNNRELATVILLALFFVALLFSRDMRHNLSALGRALLHPKLLIALFLLGYWLGIEVLLAFHLSWWNTSFITSTIFWFVGTALALFLTSPKAPDDAHFFLHRGLHAIRVSVFIDAYINLFVLSLPVELLVQGGLGFLLAFYLVATRTPGGKAVARLTGCIVGAALVLLAWYIATQAANGWTGILHHDVLKQILLPGWLTLGLLPFIYLLGLYTAYELAFLRLQAGADRAGIGWRDRLALVSSFGVRIHSLREFINGRTFRFAPGRSYRETRQAIRLGRQEKRADGDSQEVPREE